MSSNLEVSVEGIIYMGPAIFLTHISSPDNQNLFYNLSTIQTLITEKCILLYWIIPLNFRIVYPTKYIFGSSPCISSKNLKHNKFKSELILSLSTNLLQFSLYQLMATSGYYFQGSKFQSHPAGTIFIIYPESNQLSPPLQKFQPNQIHHPFSHVHFSVNQAGKIS